MLPPSMPCLFWSFFGLLLPPVLPSTSPSREKSRRTRRRNHQIVSYFACTKLWLFPSIWEGSWGSWGLFCRVPGRVLSPHPGWGSLSFFGATGSVQGKSRRIIPVPVENPFEACPRPVLVHPWSGRDPSRVHPRSVQGPSSRALV